MPLNTEEFLQTTTESALDDHLEPCPAGEWLAITGAPAVYDFVYSKGDHQGETGYRMSMKYTIQDQAVKDHCERDTVSVTQSILLDLTEDGSGLDMGKGKNIGLGQLRAALGQNVAGQDWSPAMLEGQPIKVKVKAGIWDERVTADVAGVTAP